MPHWRITFPISKEYTDYFADALVEEGVPVTTSEVTIPGASGWQLEVYLDAEPDYPAWEARLATLADAVGIAYPHPEVEVLQARDWVAESQAGFPPFSVGTFYLYGSHVTDAPPEGSLALQVDAGMAFGTGEHATTKGCLQAIADLHDSWGALPDNTPLLDMGCGSGILAMAMAKCWPDAHIVAADMDADAVRVAAENAQINGVADAIEILHSDGFAGLEVASVASYRLIMANILAGPLMDMANDLVRHLAEEGVAVLSGLLQEQEAAVLDVYQAEGLGLQQRYPMGEWVTLVLQHR